MINFICIISLIAIAVCIFRLKKHGKKNENELMENRQKRRVEMEREFKKTKESGTVTHVIQKNSRSKANSKSQQKHDRNNLSDPFNPLYIGNDDEGTQHASSRPYSYDSPTNNNCGSSSSSYSSGGGSVGGGDSFDSSCD